MSDLNVMMRDLGRQGLQTKLDMAVTNGDTDEARKISDQIAKFDLDTAPRQVVGAYGDKEIIAELNAKADWFGVDPEKSELAASLGKNMNPAKFANAEAFVKSLIEAVNKKVDGVTVKPKAGDDTTNEEDEDADDTEDEDEDEPAAPARRRRSDAPGEADANLRSNASARSGPWTKLSQAPRDVQAEIKRQTAKFVPSSAPKEQREAYEKKALEAHYASHQRSKGKK